MISQLFRGKANVFEFSLIWFIDSISKQDQFICIRVFLFLTIVRFLAFSLYLVKVVLTPYLYDLSHRFQTILTILSTDLFSLLPSFSLLPLFFPHSPTSHPSLTTFERLDKNKELVVNVILAYTLSTVAGALLGFVAERVGGYKAFVGQVYEVLVPSILSADSLTTSEMMRVRLFSSYFSLLSFLLTRTLLSLASTCFRSFTSFSSTITITNALSPRSFLYELVSRNPILYRSPFH